MKYPIGIQTFDKIILGDYVYVDKTDLIYQLVKMVILIFWVVQDDSVRAFLSQHWNHIS